MKALVLGGGSLKGAFQVGVIQAILESGFEPEMIYGISVGSLNAGFLVNAAGKQHIEEKTIDWPGISRQLIEFWIKNITHPEDIALVRSRLTLGIDTLMSRFDGLLDTTPLHTLIRKNLDEFILKNSPVKLKVGAVDVVSGKMVYATPEDESFLEYIMASSSLPTLMPAIHIKGQRKAAYLDGGLRVVAPLKAALEDGATEIVCIACHAEHIYDEPVNYRNLLKLLDRVKDINVNQIVNSDIAWGQNYVEKEGLKGRVLKLSVVRPHEPLHLDMLKFNSDDIVRLIVQGYKTGFEYIQENGLPILNTPSASAQNA
ncbi:patatin-like phospholipase family protein [Runella aurantiaca]|uniref:Patatin n=1 Tax=Runella aurantiaca TaxID=2282308 RepID=A0A369IEI3_9BACT|nr:patatin-like phospholipase family protein [Runella aurantiaca]RDB05026.1 patatin [Runella aurantiaca]